ncbi:YwiC-like family protein [Anaerobacillus sp. MEB173]|uniref:YwiC-like family protein n=1 Tax=Anaerobacillus sp. MEB173 TaxID=3383345 RepID=UPI003F90701D
MKWYIPREHGAWAMLIVPYLLGAISSGPTWLHLVFFVGVLSLYFSSAPILTYIRQPKIGKEIIPSLIIYLVVGLTFVIPVLIMKPYIILLGSFVLPFFTLNILFAKVKKERLFINDLFAIVGLSFLVLIAYYIGQGTIATTAIILMLINFVYFIASVFHVKSLIRERKNKGFKFVSTMYHGTMVAVPVIIGYPFIALALSVSAIKSFITSKNNKPNPVTIGVIEIGNSIVFVTLMALWY